MKKIVKIILILVVAFFLILGIIWLIGRNTALKNGKEPLTFRQFLGLSTKTNPTDTVPGEVGSDFNGDGVIDENDRPTGTGTIEGDTNGDGVIGAGDIGFDGSNNINVSNFTDGTTTPGGGGGGTTTPGTGPDTDPDDNDGTDGNGTGGDGDIVIENPGGTDPATQAVCSEEDLNIDFTPAQLAQLEVLQNRFYALAQTLHSDTDVETEVANRDAFSIKADNALSLYAYCESKLPIINATADARLKLHVATPFWTSYEDNGVLANFVSQKTGTAIPAVDPAVENWTFINIPGLSNVPHLIAVHDNNMDNPEVGATINGPFGNIPTGAGIKGPYGLLTITRPEGVPINGSALGDIEILLPVVEKILRLNLW